MLTRTQVTLRPMVVRFSGKLRPGQAVAVSLTSKTYPDGSTEKPGEMATRGGWLSRSVRVACDYEVAVKNPLTGRIENVVFSQVPQDRSAGWGPSGFNSSKDRNSHVLSCEGIKYESGFSAMTMEEVSQPSELQPFDVKRVPELARQVAEFERTGKKPGSR